MLNRFADGPVVCLPEQILQAVAAAIEKGIDRCQALEKEVTIRYRESNANTVSFFVTNVESFVPLWTVHVSLETSHTAGSFQFSAGPEFNRDQAYHVVTWDLCQLDTQLEVISREVTNALTPKVLEIPPKGKLYIHDFDIQASVINPHDDFEDSAVDSVIQALQSRVDDLARHRDNWREYVSHVKTEDPQ